MNRIRFFLIGAIALIVAPAMLFAGGDQEGAATDDGVIEITMLNRYSEPTWAMEKIGEELGIKIIPNGIYINDSEKVQVMVASGDVPEAGPMFDDAKQLWNEGITRSIPIDMIKQYAVEYTKRVEYDYPNAFLANQNPDNTDELLALNGIASHLMTGFFQPMFRRDWAANVGVDLPDFDEKSLSIDRFGRVYFYDQDYDFDWFEDLLVAFRDGDPDGNGQIDTIPLHANNSMARNWRMPAGSFGFAWGGNSEFNGELYDYRVHPGMKDMIALLARWYDMELIDKEFVSLPLRKGWEKITAQTVGAAFEQTTYAGRDNMMDRPPNSFVPADQLGQPGAQVVILPPLVGPNGDQGTLSYRDVVPQGSYKWYIGAQVKDDAKMAKILQLFDYSATEEGWVTWHFGDPDLHFDWEGDPWESQPIPRDAEEWGLGMVSAYPVMTFPNILKFNNSAGLTRYFDNVLLAERGQNWLVVSHRRDIKGETELTEVNSRYGAQLGTMFEEFFYRGVLGEIDVNAEWDGYVEEFMKNGGEELHAELEKAPLVSGLREGKFVY